MATGDSFDSAFNHAMLYEVGKFWNPNDPAVISGDISTKLNRQKVGYVNIPADTGGETKYGIAQNANPDVVVRTLNLAQAKEIYLKKYWLLGSCDKLSYALAIIHFDGCVNHGKTNASKFLQRAVGVADDGKIGPQTLAKVSAADPIQVITEISRLRTDFYNSIVKNKPSQKIFLNGWLTRINEVTEYTLDAAKNK